MDNNALGQKIRALREAHGWSQQDVEAHGGPRQAVVSRIELGQMNRPSYKTLEALAHAFGVSVEELMRKTEDPGGGSAPPVAKLSTAQAMDKVDEVERSLFRALNADRHSPAAFDLAREFLRKFGVYLFEGERPASDMVLAEQLLNAAVRAEKIGLLNPVGVAIGLLHGAASECSVANKNKPEGAPQPAPFIRVPTPPGATPAVRPKAVPPSAPEGKAKRASGTKPK